MTTAVPGVGGPKRVGAKPAAADKSAAAAKGAKPVAKPKVSRRTTPTPETLAALGAERLIGLVLAETARNPAFRKLVTAAVASLRGPDAVAAMIDRRLAALEGARGYIDWQKRRAFVADLDATLSVILNELRPLDAEAALERLRRFLAGADRVLERVDDSAGSVQGVYERASDAVVQVVADLTPDAAGRYAMGLMPAVLADPYGPLGALLHDLIPNLPDGALTEIDAALAEHASPASDGASGGAAPYRSSTGQTQILRLRQVLADRRNDVDAFVALEARIAPGHEDRAAIATRLLAASRAVEALDWVRRAAKPGIRIVTRADLVAGFDAEGPERERLGLEIEILDALRRPTEAQDLRWQRFERALDAPMLRLFLAKLPDFEDEEALLRALDHAQGFPDPHRALHFLAMWPALDRAARLVLDRREAWRGDRYAILAPAADALAADHPVAAATLYRRLLDGILETGHSGAYGHGARYLRALDDLSPRLAAGVISPDPTTYRDGLRSKHGRKYAFWGLMRD